MLKSPHRRKVVHHVKNTNTWTPSQKSELLEMRTRLHRDYARFRTLQSTYMLPALEVISEADAKDELEAWKLPRKRRRDNAESASDDVQRRKPIELKTLFLPSELPIDQRSHCHPGLDEIEKQMRHAQCLTALNLIRTHLHIKSALLTYKERHSRHQGMNTRSRDGINANELKIKVWQDKYNTARSALIALGVEGSDLEWRELTDADLRCMEDPEKDAKRAEWAKKKNERRQKKTMENSLEVPGPGEGFRRLSWIWEGAGRDPDASSGIHEGEHILLLSSLSVS